MPRSERPRDGPSARRSATDQAQRDPGTRDPAAQRCAELFSWLWEDLSTVVGTPAAAALLRRALVLTADKHPDLPSISIARERLTYTYKLPDELSDDPTGKWVPAFETFLKEVLDLAAAMTGGMLVRRLVQSEALRDWKLPETLEVRRWTAK